MSIDNLILATDSYKLTHWNQYPDGTQGVYSYLEARVGAEFPETVFFGLQPILNRLEGVAVRHDDPSEAYTLARAHFGPDVEFNYGGWQRIVEEFGGHLPIRIRAVPEGTVVPINNVLMTVESLDPQSYWLTNALESLLLHVWYPTTVATLSYNVKKLCRRYLEETADSLDALPFMLHDFGYRGATSHESAAIGGAGHLVNFMGTDTLPAMLLAQREYDATLDNLAFSVPATEHSVMTSLGQAGEHKIVGDLLDNHPRGILSIVADSYDIYRFVSELGTTFRERVLARDGKIVVRPDSVTKADPTPEQLVVTLMESLWMDLHGMTNSKGYRVLDPHVGMIWGDGIDIHGIERILAALMEAGFAADNIVFGMGGGLLQKVNRDTQRFAFKSSAQKRNGVWLGVAKQPLDANKASKEGRLALVRDRVRTIYTVRCDDENGHPDDLLETVFENGRVTRRQTFDDVRARAAEAVS